MKSEAEEYGLPSRTVGEEIANTLTHGAGLLGSLVAMAFMLYKAWTNGDAWHVAGCAIFGTTLVLLYMASTLYHGVREPRLKQLCRVLDHSAIYLLIAGSYAPFALVTLRHDFGWLLFGVVWGFALLGILLKLRKQNRRRDVGLVICLVMGWMAVFAIKPLVELLPTAGVVWLFAGGLIYTAGIAFYALGIRCRRSNLW